MSIRRSTLWLSLAALVAGLLAWGVWRWYEGRYPTWKEEVRLSDGRVILIKQKHEYYDNYGTAQSWLTFSLPEMGGERTWHSYLKPMRVDVQDGKVYVFGRPRGPREVSHYRYPKYLIVAFVWQGNDFVRVPFIAVPAALRSEENVLSCVDFAQRRQITVEWKSENWCPPAGDRGQLVRQISLAAYEEMALSYARLDGANPVSE